MTICIPLSEVAAALFAAVVVLAVIVGANAYVTVQLVCRVQILAKSLRRLVGETLGEDSGPAESDDDA